VQEKRARKMGLSVAVLDDVRRELASSQNLSDRPVLTAVRRLGKDDLAALRNLVFCCGQATFEDMWNLEFLIRGTEKWSRNKLEEYYEKLISSGVLKLGTEQKIDFNGDEFDKIYTKYLSLQKRERVYFTDLPPGFFFRLNAFRRLQELGEGSFFRGLEEASSEEVDSVLEELEDDSQDKDVFAEQGRLARHLYMLQVKHIRENILSVTFVNITHPWGSDVVLLQQNRGEDKTAAFFDALRSRLTKLGGSLDFEVRSLKTISLEKLIQKVETTKNERIRNDIGSDHKLEMITQYIEKSNLEEAYFHAKLALKFGQKFDAVDRNNIGYVAFADGHYEEAKNLFVSSINNWPREEKALLPTYNLAILLAKQNDIQSAIERVALVHTKWRGRTQAKPRRAMPVHPCAPRWFVEGFGNSR